jgi:DNA-directed RNA polymerase specialized sigma24 family protein
MRSHWTLAIQSMDTNDEVFNKLLARLEPDLTDSTIRYKQLRLKMIRFFQWKRCGDAEILADETIARAVKKIIEGDEIHADDPYVYIRAIANNVYREYVRGEIKTRKLLANLLQPTLEPEVSEDCRIQCLRNLPSDRLKLLQEYFLDEKDSQLLAEELNITINALRLQMHRLKKRLDSCYEDCLKKLSEG